MNDGDRSGVTKCWGYILFYTYIFPRCVCVLSIGAYFIVCIFHIIFFSFGACKRSFRWMHNNTLLHWKWIFGFRFYLLFFFIWSFVHILCFFILSLSYYRERERETPVARIFFYLWLYLIHLLDKFLSNCIFTLIVCSWCIFNTSMCVPLGECFRSISFFHSCFRFFRQLFSA